VEGKREGVGSLSSFPPPPCFIFSVLVFGLSVKKNVDVCVVYIQKKGTQIFIYLIVLLFIFFWTSNQARLPAELKHINKRRKRN
jgi:hypothetical protein